MRQLLVRNSVLVKELICMGFYLFVHRSLKLL
jgi:hypothetical protein